MAAKKKTSKKRSKTSSKDIKLVEKLAKNSLDLQKATLKLVETNNDVIKRIDRLVGLFEEASKHVSEVDEDMWRGTFAADFKWRSIFSKKLSIRINEIPSLEPKIIIDSEILEMLEESNE